MGILTKACEAKRCFRPVVFIAKPRSILVAVVDLKPVAYRYPVRVRMTTTWNAVLQLAMAGPQQS